MTKEINELQADNYACFYLDTVEVADSSSAKPTIKSITCGDSAATPKQQNQRIFGEVGTTWDHARAQSGSASAQGVSRGFI
jgi:hypothetical protein